MYVGIENSNDFYSQHYLSAILAGDLKSHVYSLWNDPDEERQPWMQVRSLARDFFKTKNELGTEKDPLKRIQKHRAFAQSLIFALGYEPTQQERLVRDAAIPIYAGINRAGTSDPIIWWIPVISPTPEPAEALKAHFHPAQFSTDLLEEIKDEFFERTVEDIINKDVFGTDAPPRFVVLIAEEHILLLDRAKWAEQRLLKFDLNELLGRQESDALKAFTGLLHRNSTAPEDGTSILDTLDESSHKHAHGVSKDLKYALRECIELLGNAAVEDLKRQKIGVYDRQTADVLSIECLRFMYRLLFLFYIEARPELGYAPMKSATYLKGYSVESLRDLETVRLHTPEAREGTYIHDSIRLLFDLIYNGSKTTDQTVLGASDHGIFRLAPLKSHLFDPDRTPTLNRVRFTNEVMQRVINLMSLSKATGRTGRTGRISYAQLGINQLGAVYEALLSYRGFFAEEDLYEVAPKASDWDPLETAYFVNRQDLERYTEDERVIDPTTNDYIKHPRGKFIYRMAGRDREKSASYYTPESLTQCLVKYALKEVLEDEDGNPKKAAKDILDIKICEPAMGSAAFLNEAVNQLSEAYLKARQRELDQRISHEDYAWEKQRVKTYIADNNVFGVDLNPIAVELAEVSLWLNAIHESRDGQNFVPWFGMQLTCGNSLIGARLDVYPPSMTTGKKQSWLGAEPQRIGHKKPPQGAIYHFLLPDPAMAQYKDKVIKGNKNQPGLAQDAVEAIEAWRKANTGNLNAEHSAALVELSEAVWKLMERHTKMLSSIRRRTTDPFEVYGQEPQSTEFGTTRPVPQSSSTRDKDKIWHGEVFSEGVRSSSPYRRLKLVMDYWCALWFWPLEQADELPDREEFLFDLSTILDANLVITRQPEQADIFAPTMPKEEAESMAKDLGTVDVDALIKRNPRLKIVQELADRYRFLHWELEFADIFAERGGFDLILGNPPWLKVEWNEGGVMGDADPYFVLRKISASEAAKLRVETLEKRNLTSRYFAEYEEAEGTKNYLNALQNYPELKGQKANLYKCFLPLAWRTGSESGVSGFLHPETVYDDPRGGDFRAEIYPRLRYHFQFENELQLFPIGGTRRYGVQVYGQPRTISFLSMSNVFHPQAIHQSFEHSGVGPIPGIKDHLNNWNVKGHKSLLMKVTKEELELFARLYDDEGTPPNQARLPALHVVEFLDVLHKFAAQPRRLGDFKGQHYSTQHWNETNSQEEGTIKHDTSFPIDANEWILSGPHFYVGNPLYQTARAVCTEKGHYDVIDLTLIPDDYLPRTKYIPACSPAEYAARSPRVPWGEQRPVTDFYRVVFSRQLSQSGERTMQPALIPPGPGHIHPVISLTLSESPTLFAGLCSSVVYDFFLKTTGKSDLYGTTLVLFPWLESKEIVARALRLNCLTKRYADLWTQDFHPDMQNDEWLLNDPRLTRGVYANLTSTWHRNYAFLADFERRAALVEIDVITAKLMGITLDELLTIYRVQFFVLRDNESDTWYDQNGRIIFTKSRGLTGVGLPRRKSSNYPVGPYWEDVKDMQQGTVHQTIIDDTLPGGPVERTITYVAPFTRCDREEDYRTAWTEFEKRVPK